MATPAEAGKILLSNQAGKDRGRGPPRGKVEKTTNIPAKNQTNKRRVSSDAEAGTGEAFQSSINGDTEERADARPVRVKPCDCAVRETDITRPTSHDGRLSSIDPSIPSEEVPAAMGIRNSPSSLLVIGRTRVPVRRFEFSSSLRAREGWLQLYRAKVKDKVSSLGAPVAERLDLKRAGNDFWDKLWVEPSCTMGERLDLSPSKIVAKRGTSGELGGVE